MSLFKFAAKAVVGSVAAAGAIAALPVLGGLGAVSTVGMAVAGAVGVANATLEDDDDSVQGLAEGVKALADIKKS